MAVAFYLGNRYADRITFLIVENSFYSISEHVAISFPPILSFLGHLIFEKWESWKEFEEMLQKPHHPKVLLMRGEKDYFVMAENLEKLEQVAFIINPLTKFFK